MTHDIVLNASKGVAVPILSRLLRIVAVLGVALPLAVVVATPSTASPSDSLLPPPQPRTLFFADHRERCAYAYTAGEIDWNPVAVTRYPVVHISGALVDEPRMCADSRLGGVFATFTAYVRDHKVDERIVYLNESVDADLGGWAKRLDFLLTAPDFGLIIDRVDVQVCRDFGPMLPAFSCGDLQSYHRRMFVPAE